MRERSLIDVDIEIDGSVISVSGREREYDLFFTRNFNPETIAKYEDQFIEYTSILKRPYIIGKCRLKETIPFKMISSTFAFIS